MIFSKKNMKNNTPKLSDLKSGYKQKPGYISEEEFEEKSKSILKEYIDQECQDISTLQLNTRRYILETKRYETIKHCSCNKPWYLFSQLDDFIMIAYQKEVLKNSTYIIVISLCLKCGEVIISRHRI